jgi:hypothetical protein
MKTNIPQKRKTRQSKKTVNQKKNQNISINELKPPKQPLTYQEYREKVANLFEDENFRSYITNNIMWAGGEDRPSFRLKNLRISLVRIAFFFVKYHYETHLKGVVFNPTYDSIEKFANVARSSVAEAIKVFEVVGGLSINRRYDKKGYITSSEYEVNILFMEAFIEDNFAEITFTNDKSGKKRANLIQNKRPVRRKSKVIHSNQSDSEHKTQISNYNYNKKSIVKEKEIPFKNVDKKRFYKIAITELYQKLYTKVVSDIKTYKNIILKDSEIKTSMTAFIRMCGKESITEMTVNEFRRRIKAWVISFNDKLAHKVASTGMIPKWKSLRRKLSDIWVGISVNLDNEFYTKVIERMKRIKRAKGFMPSKEQLWQAKEILINKKNYLTYEEDAITILANYVLNLRRE